MKNKKHKDYEHHLQTTLPVHYHRDGHLDKYDKRSKIYMILATNYNDIVEDAGGIENLSKVKLSLIERFVFVQQYLRALERRIIRCKKGKVKAKLMTQHGYHCNSLLGLSKKIGLDKKHKAKFVNIKSYAAERDRKKA